MKGDNYKLLEPTEESTTKKIDNEHKDVFCSEKSVFDKQKIKDKISEIWGE